MLVTNTVSFDNSFLLFYFGYDFFFSPTTYTEDHILMNYILRPQSVFTARTYLFHSITSIARIELVNNVLDSSLLWFVFEEGRESY